MLFFRKNGLDIDVGATFYLIKIDLSNFKIPLIDLGDTAYEFGRYWL